MSIQINSWITGRVLKTIGADSLVCANLSYANLSYADLSYANLSSANLRGANLSYADLSNADLSYADLSSANLRGADLSSANLRGANLRGANLSSANLRGANLSSAKLPSPTMVLLANWNEVSDQLCADLMEYDAWAHGDKKAFKKWVKTGSCPYACFPFQRAALFLQKPNLFGKGKLRSPIELVKKLFKEKGIKF